MAKVVHVLLKDGQVDWDPPGLIHLKQGESVTWKNHGNSLKVEFRNGHPFEESPPFQATAGETTKNAKVRADAPKKTFPCFVTLDGRTRQFADDGVIID